MDDSDDIRELEASKGTTCWICGEFFVPTPAQRRQWFDLETIYDLTNFECADCQENPEGDS